VQIQGQREVVTSLHWPIQDLGMERRGSLPARATCTTIRCSQRVPHIIVEEVFEGTRGTIAIGGVECAGLFDLHKAPSQNPRHSRENHPD
jgi:hypothetical protein